MTGVGTEAGTETFGIESIVETAETRRVGTLGIIEEALKEAGIRRVISETETETEILVIWVEVTFLPGTTTIIICMITGHHIEMMSKKITLLLR
jgi:hypothetical protein